MKPAARNIYAPDGAAPDRFAPVRLTSPGRKPGAAGDYPRIISVNLSAAKGERKRPAASAQLKRGHGLVGDGHAGARRRQVSLLAWESIEKMRQKGLDVGAGDFAENVTTSGIDLVSLPVGTRLRLGPAEVEVTQIGKRCHDRCEIFRQAGDCVMPREGIFAAVLQGGRIAPGDRIDADLGANGPGLAGSDRENAR